MQFADYDYYTQDFGGSKLSEEEFYHAIKYVSSFIQLCTFGRAEQSQLDAVKDAACAGCERYVEIRCLGMVKNENTDGYAVSYKEISGKDLYCELDSVIHPYLEPYGLTKRI